MSDGVERHDPHTAVKTELLVRYLDVWTPTVLRSHRRATYVDCGDGGHAVAALRVFGEFADRLVGHQLDVVVHLTPEEPLMAVLRELGEPPGLSLRSLDVTDHTVAGPVLAHLDLVGEAPLDEATAWRLVASMARNKAAEVLLVVPPVAPERVLDLRRRLRDAGLGYAVHVELTDREGRAQLLLFATKVKKHLVTFKDAMWAADEYAGIRYRDPRDPEHILVDIALRPQLHPLRRVLLDELARRGRCSVADLQQHTLTETIYQPADALRVLASAATGGTIDREPAKGRLTPRTIVRLNRSAG
ncbi:MAG: hypothetical protein GEU86_20745 [Actinophytocola sp.]|nr:hypothetical protein [Actinophytocola sp.]